MAPTRLCLLLVSSLPIACIGDSDVAKHADPVRPQSEQEIDETAPPSTGTESSAPEFDGGKPDEAETPDPEIEPGDEADASSSSASEPRSSSEPIGESPTQTENGSPLDTGSAELDAASLLDTGSAELDAPPAPVPDAAAPVPDATVAAAENYDCVVTSSSYNLYPMSIRWRVTWDAPARVKSQLVSEAPDGAVRLAWRYDADGRLLAYAGFGPGTYDNFQHDLKYDARNHVVDFYLSYPAQPDLQVPSTTAPWMGTTYVNEYGVTGELTASTATPYGPGYGVDVAPTRYTFRHDAEGRCQHIETTGGRLEWTETRSYDTEGRLQMSEWVYSHPIGINMACTERITSHDYDALGRLTRTTTRCRATPTRDAWVETHSYASDGSETIETFDFTNDVVNDTITIDGVAVRFAHSLETRTAGCAAIENAIAVRSDRSCRTR